MIKQQNPIIVIEGIQLRIDPPDLDGDGQTGGIETIPMDNTTSPIYQESEMSESMKELNNDAINEQGMSAIDFNSRLAVSEEPSITAFESLCGKLIPNSWLTLTTKAKRNKVSILGKGRAEKVQLVTGKLERDVKLKTFSFKESGKNIFGLGKKQNDGSE